MSQKFIIQTQEGFTIIEMLVSLALFTIVATVATGALVSLIGNNQRLVGEQDAMTTLSFALDSMAREIRTGSEYRCGTASNIQINNYDEDDFNDCSDGRGLSFREGGESISNGQDNRRVAYYIDTAQRAIMRKVGSGNCSVIPTPSSCVALTPANIEIKQLRFHVSDSKPLTDRSGTINMGQPTVTIIIVANPIDDESDKDFIVQTTVTQRALDI